MNPTTELILMVILGVIILVSLALSAVTIIRRSAKKPNPNAIIVPAPEQEDFEPHPEWNDADDSKKQDS